MRPGKNVNRLRAALAEARRRLKLVAAARTQDRMAGDRNAYEKAVAEVELAERAVAEASGQSYAEPVAFDLKWEDRGSSPHLLQSERRTLLVFECSEPDRLTGHIGPGIVGIVDFVSCLSAKFGSPDNEVFQDHPLIGSGIQPYRAVEIRASPWVRELEAVNAYHAQFDPARWTGMRHYLLGFRNVTFECVAQPCLCRGRSAPPRTRPCLGS